MFLSTLQAIRRTFCNLSLARNERGAVLVYVTLLLPVFIGGGLLAIDAARLYNLNTHLQKAADALALAGAAELDSRADATDRAKRAINTLVSNEQRFASQGVTFEVDEPVFLTSLPDDDAQQIVSPDEVPPPAEVRFVQVTVRKGTLKTLFPASLFGGLDTTATTATAVAGFKSVYCKTLPMFICNPFGAGLADAPSGLQIKLQLGNRDGGDAQYFPGNYGWLQSPNFERNGNGQLTDKGAQVLRRALAAVRPPVCFEQGKLSVQTGNITSANDAINVRFDLWAGSFKNEIGNPEYRPARNVRKGYSPVQPNGGGKEDPCKPVSEPQPQDDNNCKIGEECWRKNQARLGQDKFDGGHLGDGDWKPEVYWKTNYGTDLLPSGLPNKPSRYDVYKYELSEGLFQTKSGDPYSEKGESACYPPDDLTDEPDRRIIYAAIIDCDSQLVTGSSSDLTAIGFGKFFLTEPVPDPPNDTIYAEFRGFIKPGDGSNEVARDMVQLYR